jgi:hypothetical protein
MIDFQGATISSDTGFILLREIDDRFRIIDPMKECLEDLRSPVHTKHALVQVVRQRVYQIAASYEDCNDADFLRIDPALSLAIGKDHKTGAGQSMLSRLENDVLGKAYGYRSPGRRSHQSHRCPVEAEEQKAVDYRPGFH